GLVLRGHDAGGGEEGRAGDDEGNETHEYLLRKNQSDGHQFTRRRWLKSVAHPAPGSLSPDRQRARTPPMSTTTDKQVTFSLLATDGMGRRGRIDTPRGPIHTPAFMPVGTAGTVKAMYPEQVRETGADILLGNTYHLMLRPGAERVAKLGGLHDFMDWQRPILTDSGGFQVMSLAKLRKLNEHGVTFRSHIDGAAYELTPERSIEIQTLLDSDIIMQLDECIPLPSDFKEMERAMELSLRWADRSKQAFGNQPARSLHGIV